MTTGIPLSVWYKFGPPVRLAFIAAWNERADQDHAKHKNLPCFVKYGGDVSLNSDRSLNSKKSSFLIMGTATGTGIWRVKILVPIPVPVALPVQYTMDHEYPILLKMSLRVLYHLRPACFRPYSALSSLHTIPSCPGFKTPYDRPLC
jgi:hypothetical protein